MILYKIDENGLFVGTVDVLSEKDFSGLYTKITPPSFDSGLYYIQFDGTQWQIKDQLVTGLNVYKKSTGELATSIKAAERNLYAYQYEIDGIKNAKIKALQDFYIKSQEAIITNCGTDTVNGNISIISKIIMRDANNNGDLDLIRRQKDLANDYGVSFIQLDGYKQNQDESYTKTGITYCGYLLKSEWKSFYGDLINQSSQNFVTYQKLLQYINSLNSFDTLNGINFSNYFTIPYNIDLGSKVNRGSDPFLLPATDTNLYAMQIKIKQIMASNI